MCLYRIRMIWCFSHWCIIHSFFIRKAHLDEELEPQLLELQKKAGKKVPQIELQTGRQSVKLALRDIWFVESEKNYLLFLIGKKIRGMRRFV